MSRILIVDDEQAIGWSLRELLGDDGHQVELAASVEAAVEACGRFRPEAILLDVRLGSRDGLAALPDLRAIVADVPVVVMTAFGDLDTAVRAVQAGASDYLLKPFDLERVSAVVARALADLADRAGSTVAAPVAEPAAAGRIVGTTPPMQEVFKQIALVAATDLPVLVSGETGTGKELVARAIHAHGRRQQGPFVAVNLAALAPGAVDESLFGQVGGGATADRPGLFALAAGGTIFLDEIGEASADVQVKLLRVLAAHEVTPVGAAGGRPVDVRVIAATNRDLTAAVAEGRFRSDLYHRLHAFPLRLPPLADRTADIAPLARHFLALHVARQGDSAATLTPEFVAALERRSWPGNVRELKHAVEYAAVMARGGMLRPEHLPAGPAATGSGAGPALESALDSADKAVTAAVRDWSAAARLAWGDSPEPDLHRRAVELLEATLFREALAHSGGNRTAAAKLLGLDRATLRTRLRHLGIED